MATKFKFTLLVTLLSFVFGLGACSIPSPQCPGAENFPAVPKSFYDIYKVTPGRKVVIYFVKDDAACLNMYQLMTKTPEPYDTVKAFFINGRDTIIFSRESFCPYVLSWEICRVVGHLEKQVP